MVILDFEDSVAPERKVQARDAVAAWLAMGRTVPTFVRINPLDSGHAPDDLAAVLPGQPDGAMLPKAEARGEYSGTVFPGGRGNTAAHYPHRNRDFGGNI